MINALINKHLPKAFDTQLKDAIKPFTGTRQGGADSYDPVLDEYIAGSDITYTGRGTFGRFKAQEIQATQIDIVDVKLTCLQIEVTDTPKVDDTITYDNQELRVMDVGQDPTGSIWTIQLRGLHVGQSA